MDNMTVFYQIGPDGALTVPMVLRDSCLPSIMLGWKGYITPDGYIQTHTDPGWRRVPSRESKPTSTRYGKLVFQVQT
jgi:hypothetical protein